MNWIQDLEYNIDLRILVQDDNIIGVIDCDLYGDQWVDLYIQFQKLYKECYSPGDVIVVKSTYDYYQNNHAGIILQSVQSLVNTIDISNFFIRFETTNKDIHNEYQYILETYSTDKVPFTLKVIPGSFIKKKANTKTPFIKLQNLVDIETIESLTQEQKNLLFASKSFCIAPWTALEISAGSSVRPCCEYRGGSVGNAAENSLSEIWNNDSLRTIRKKMLNNQEVEGCKRCYTKEQYGRDSLRNSFNRRFGRYITKVSATNDYSCNFELVYLDARFNNLCNLSCRSCNHISSTSWHKPAVALGLIAKDTPVLSSAGRYPGDLLNQIKKHIHTIQSIYFAGGEPLIIEEFYQLLEELDKAGRHDVELIYNTNLTQSYLKDKSIFDHWKNFKNISIGASLDAEAERAEYLRCGTKWNDIVEFRKQIFANRPDIDFYINCTTGIINALHIVDFHRSWADKGLIRPEDFNVHLLFEPEYMNVSNSPEVFKEKIKQKYNEHLKWLKPLDTLGRASFGFESIIKHLDSNNHFDRKLFWDNVNSLDGYYKTDLLSVFPELDDLK